MSPRGKNLLEAFSNGSGNPAPTPLPTGSKSGAPSLPLLGTAGARRSLTLRASQVQWLVLAQVVLIVLAFLLGRASVANVAEAAAEPSDAAPSAQQKPVGELIRPAQTPEQPAARPQVQPAPPPVNSPAQPANAQVDNTPRTAAEQALLDPRNVYTLKVADYVYNDSSLKLARDALKYLSETCALPACLTRHGSRLYLLVGAAPRQVDLDGLGRTVRELKGPPPISKPKEFHDAYVEKIDKVFQRK